LVTSYLNLLPETAQHANLLQRLNQPVPQTLTYLLADARRREQKKQAKRIANRKSASTSRARKKALIQEMTELNVRLKRQALILSLLPDLVIVIDVNGIITFCSEQVDRVLMYKSESLVGSNISDIIVPSSRKRFDNLVKGLIAAGPVPVSVASQQKVPDVEALDAKPAAAAKSDASNQDASGEDSSAVVSSDPSFPLAVVNVEPVAKPTGSDESNGNSDASASRDSKQPSSLTTNTDGSLPRSPTGADSDETKGEARKKASNDSKSSAGSSDESNTSSFSVEPDVNKLQKANANLERNVRWHNKKLHSVQDSRFIDDVTGATVTANNATARLSSLRVSARTETSSSEEDDSGYRESNESREETSSSTSSEAMSDSNGTCSCLLACFFYVVVANTFVGTGRRRPLAPTCNVCLIRNDLTTIWCEVTSSIRAREEVSTEVLSSDDLTIPETKPPPAASSKPVGSKSSVDELSDVQSSHDEVKEIFLCLRPIRDGQQKLDEEHRFLPAKREVSDDTGPSTSSGENASSSPGPPEKRKKLGDSMEKRKRKREDETSGETAAESEDVKSLMTLNDESTL
jgi:hypothetical protein